jgi:selenoprotein W-related protein
LKFKQEIGGLRLIPSAGGVFEVIVDGKLIYSKKATGEFPDPDAVVQQVRELK